MRRKWFKSKAVLKEEEKQSLRHENRKASGRQSAPDAASKAIMEDLALIGVL